MKQLTAQQHTDFATKAQRKAKRLYTHYFQQVLEHFDSDTSTELDETIDCIIEAATHRALAIMKETEQNS